MEAVQWLNRADRRYIVETKLTGHEKERDELNEDEGNLTNWATGKTEHK